jgi:hypothetical protein
MRMPLSLLISSKNAIDQGTRYRSPKKVYPLLNTLRSPVVKLHGYCVAVGFLWLCRHAKAAFLNCGKVMPVAPFFVVVPLKAASAS